MKGFIKCTASDAVKELIFVKKKEEEAWYHTGLKVIRYIHGICISDSDNLHPYMSAQDICIHAYMSLEVALKFFNSLDSRQLEILW